MVHRPPVEVISIQVLDVGGGLLRGMPHDHWVVSPGVPPGNHGDFSAHSLLNEEVLVVVGQEFQLHPSLF